MRGSGHRHQNNPNDDACDAFFDDVSGQTLLSHMRFQPPLLRTGGHRGPLRRLGLLAGGS